MWRNIKYDGGKEVALGSNRGPGEVMEASVVVDGYKEGGGWTKLTQAARFSEDAVHTLVKVNRDREL